jgi:hypothetical protein
VAVTDSAASRPEAAPLLRARPCGRQGPAPHRSELRPGPRERSRGRREHFLGAREISRPSKERSRSSWVNFAKGRKGSGREREHSRPLGELSRTRRESSVGVPLNFRSLPPRGALRSTCHAVDHTQDWGVKSSATRGNPTASPWIPASRRERAEDPGAEKYVCPSAYPASSYACRSQPSSSASTSSGPSSRTSWCQRFAETCSRLAMRGPGMSAAALRVRIRAVRRVAMPAGGLADEVDGGLLRLLRDRAELLRRRQDRAVGRRHLRRAVHEVLLDSVLAACLAHRHSSSMLAHRPGGRRSPPSHDFVAC